MASFPRRDPRVDELLAERALFGLNDVEARELERLQPAASEDESFDRAAAALHLAMLSKSDLNAPPAALLRRLDQSGERWCRSASSGVAGRIEGGGVTSASAEPRSSSASSSRGGSNSLVWSGWVAAAACLMVAVVLAVRVSNSSTIAATAPSALLAQVAAAPDAVRLNWGDWALEGQGPEHAGVTGEVIWSDALQRGVMRFTNLPANDRTREQYQLWIVDAERGMSQRISGGVFDGSTGEVIVPIEPRLMVKKAAAFAVTIEQPGGTWVSDMSRRLVIAAR